MSPLYPPVFCRSYSKHFKSSINELQDHSVWTQWDIHIVTFSKKFPIHPIRLKTPVGALTWLQSPPNSGSPQQRTAPLCSTAAKAEAEAFSNMTPATSPAVVPWQRPQVTTEPSERLGKVGWLDRIFGWNLRARKSWHFLVKISTNSPFSMSFLHNLSVKTDELSTHVKHLEVSEKNHHVHLGFYLFALQIYKYTNEYQYMMF